MSLTRAQQIAHIASLITDPYNEQNSAARVREAFLDIIKNCFNLAEDGVSGVKGNFNATAAPTPNNDSTQNYSKDSTWIFGNNIYKAKSVDVGSAVWVLASTPATNAAFATLGGNAIDNISLVNYIDARLASQTITGQSLGHFREGITTPPIASQNTGDVIFYTKTSTNPEELWMQVSDGVSWVDKLKFDTALGGNPLVQDLTNPNATDVLSTQGVVNAIAAIGGGGSTDDEKWLPNHNYAEFETFTIKPTQVTPIDKDGNTLQTGKVYNVYYDSATTSSASLTLAEIAKLSVVKDVNENSFSTRQFVNGTMLFNGNVIYSDTHVQNGVEAFSLVNSVDNITGSTHFLKYTSNGDVINATAVFNDFGKGVFAYMKDNPATYEVRFDYIKTSSIEEIWVTAKRAEASSSGNPTGQYQGSFNEGDVLPDAVVNSGDFIYLVKNSGEFWIQVSNGVAWIDDKQITDPIALQALTVANNVQNEVNVINQNLIPEIRAFNPTITFDKDVTYSPIYVQNGAVSFSEAGIGKDGATHYGIFKSDGSAITFPANFNEITKDMISYMVANPNEYEIMFLKIKTPVIDKVWMSAPKATAANAVAPQAATSSSINNNLISENSPIGTPIGVINSNALPTATSYLLSGADSSKFQIFSPSNGLFILLNISVFDFENPTSAGGTNDYKIEVAAVNGVGTQATPSPITITVTNVAESNLPSQPLVLDAQINPFNPHNNVILSWNAPVSDGGSQITSYKVEKESSTPGTWNVVQPAYVASGDVVDYYTPADVGVSNSYRVSATTANGTGAPSAASTITTSQVPALASYLFNQAAPHPNVTDLNGAHTSVAGFLGNGISWNSKAGGSYAANLFNIAQSKLTSIADTATDYYFEGRVKFNNANSKIGITLRATSSGNYTIGYLIQLDKSSDKMKVFSVTTSTFDAILPYTTTSLAINVWHRVRVKIFGDVLTVYINNMNTPVFTHTFVQNLHAAGGIVISGGWDSTNESDVIIDEVGVVDLVNF